jgi:hypothetical protein
VADRIYRTKAAINAVDGLRVALVECIVALEDEGHSDAMARALCDQPNECWKCRAVIKAQAALDAFGANTV